MRHNNVIKYHTHVDLYKTLISSGVTKLNQHIEDTNAVFELVHAHYSYLAYTNQLSNSTWNIIDFKDKRLILHKEFLTTQDNFANYENSQLDWSAKDAKKILKQYLMVKEKFRIRHLKIFNAAVKHTEVKTKRLVRKHLSTKHVNRMYKKIHTLVGIPSHLDAPELYTILGISKSLIVKIAPYAKIHECGIIMSSRLHRNDTPRGHDYFSYAARTSSTKNEISRKLKLTAAHEGSHGALDEILIYMLAIPHNSMIYEGIPGSLGNDGRDRQRTEIKFLDLINKPHNQSNNNLRKELFYNAGPKFFSTLVLDLQKRLKLSKHNAWVTIFATSLETAMDLRQLKGFTQMRTNKKISLFLKGLISNMGCEINDLTKLYDSLNASN